ncbi:MAG: bifunctional diaminohydroxyphosphoribosylaminopyrimidine deaminase/5-amino-6-(5-phosphoribosylamino)uracil reductase RibD [Candidatus Woesearchaeota archaeon]|nr:bifunctional diaminohydroxyphosphoribosylaminopyrimidine deaminase/5-amino-6-(5-phosphoribosylamino)uracil reductase RibD [Candidatus Woesearchaeota archaeon]
MNDHYKYMQLAIELAKKAEGKTSPNPIAGAVIVKNGDIIGQGYHKKAGMPHAEVEAINSVQDKSLLKGSTLYVTLEPCCHYGRTGPCTKEIIKAGIKEVYAAMIDPNPKNNGKGSEELRRAGIPVYVGIMENEARKMNEAFVKYITTKKPFVIMKTAISLDGKTATKKGHSKWISSEESRNYVHTIRNKVDAVMVGINTVLADDPHLTTRIEGGKDPLRIILDSKLRIPLNARILKDKNAIIATTQKYNRKKKVALERRGIGVVVVNSNSERVDMKELMNELALRGITSIMIEGGSEVNASALKAGIVDKVIYFIAPKIIGGKDAKPAVGGEGINYMDEAIELKNVEVKRVGPDIVVEGYL